MNRLIRKAGRVDYRYRMPLRVDADLLAEYADIVDDLVNRGASEDFVAMPVAVIDVAMQALGGEVKKYTFDDMNGLMRTDLLTYDEFVDDVKKNQG